MLELYGAEGSGSIAVEAALTLLEIPYTLIEGATWAHESARERVAPVNAMRQVPTLIFPGGEIMTESAAILIDLADRHPAAASRARAQRPPPPAIPALDGLRFLRHLLAALDQTRRRAASARPPESRNAVVDAVHERIAFCWQNMDAQIAPGRYLLGDELTVLDLYVTVVSRFGPWRKRFYAAAPKMTPVVKRVDAEPRLAEFWARRFPFDDGWE